MFTKIRDIKANISSGFVKLEEESLEKAHVKSYVKTTKSGKQVQVREHEDKRIKKEVPKNFAVALQRVLDENKGKIVKTSFILKEAHKIAPRTLPWSKVMSNYRGFSRRIYLGGKGYEEVKKNAVREDGSINQSYIDNMALYSYLRKHLKTGNLQKVGKGEWKIKK